MALFYLLVVTLFGDLLWTLIDLLLVSLFDFLSWLPPASHATGRHAQLRCTFDPWFAPPPNPFGRANPFGYRLSR